MPAHDDLVITGDPIALKIRGLKNNMGSKNEFENAQTILEFVRQGVIERDRNL
ncbi:MAG: hypothetical protein P8Y45_02180 [Exilibacterium sp.]